MPPSMNRQILLRRRPSGMPEPGDFELVESPVPTPGEGSDAGIDRAAHARCMRARGYRLRAE